MITGSVRVALPRPQAAADFQARHARQHPVEDDQIGRGFLQPQFGLVAALDALDDIAFGFQIIGQQQAEGGFVLDDQNARSSAGGCGSDD